MLKIDCHTHIFTKEIREDYFSRTDGYALVMQMLASLMENDTCVQTVLEDKRLFLCACIDIHQPIAPQLDELEPEIDRLKIVGLKIYLTYQSGRASDEALYPVYRFAERHRLTITFHTGLCSLVLPTDNDMEGSSAKYVEQAAIDFPHVNFVIAHMDDPRFMECVRIVAAHDNLYTDISGAYETGTKEGSDVDGAIATFAQAIHSQPGMEKKILYGTDFCPPINLAQLDEYDYSIEKIFDKKDYPLIYSENCLRAFPRLKDYISGGQQ